MGGPNHNEGVDYSFIPTEASLVSGFNVVVNLFMEAGAQERNMANPQYLELISGTFHNKMQSQNGKFNPYTGKRYQKAPDEEFATKCKEQVDFLSEEYGKILNREEMKQYPGMSSFLGFQKKLIDATKDGVDRNYYLNKFGGASYYNGNPDWLEDNAKTKEVYTPKQFDDMMTGMKYDKMFENLDARIDLEMEMDKKQYTAEEKKQFATRIKALNEELIGIYEHQSSQESYDKYSQFFLENKPATGAMWGARGPHKEIPGLKAQNEALANGWDPTKISDYNKMQALCDTYAESARQMAKVTDPQFQNLGKYMEELGKLSPKGRTFENQDAFDLYCMEFSIAAKNLGEEAKKPGMQQAIQKAGGESSWGSQVYLNVGAEEIAGLDYFAEEKALSPERIKELPEAQALQNRAEASRVQDGFSDFRNQAKEKLRHFTNDLDGKRKSNSEYYENMKQALEGVATLPESASLDEINASFDKLAKASEAYTKKRSGLFKRKDGQERLDAAADLTAFAKNAKNGMNELAKGTIVEKHPDKKLGDLVEKPVKQTSEEKELDQEFNDAMEHMEKESMKKEAPVASKHKTPMDKIMEQFQSEANQSMHQSASRLGGNDDMFSYLTAAVIANEAYKIKMRKSGEEPDPKHNPNLDATRLGNDPAFKAMMKDICGDVEKQQELASLEPAEVYTKFVLNKRNFKQRQAESLQNANQKQAGISQQSPEKKNMGKN